MRASLDHLDAVGCDLYFTVTNRGVAAKIRGVYPAATVYLVENRGRDILPFVRVFSKVQQMGYEAICKLHGKKSLHRVDGERLRDELSSALAGSTTQISGLIQRFREDPGLGLVVPENHLIEHTDLNMASNHAGVAHACRILGLEFASDRFPAGSMYWFRPQALAGLEALQAIDFDIERGLCDGTLPHAVERLICLLVGKSGHTVSVC